jgi:hypothetical protein
MLRTAWHIAVDENGDSNSEILSPELSPAGILFQEIHCLVE